MWENTVAIHSVLNKKNYKGKFLANSILKKIDKYNFMKKKNKMKKTIREKNKKKYYKIHSNK
jgi:hypothetical protein